MYFSKADLYPEQGNTLTTSEQTIPTREAENYAVDKQISDNGNGMAQSTTGDTKTKIWGSILLLFGVMVVLHYID